MIHGSRLSITLVIALMAALGIAVTHNTFALYRARIALAAELNADGVPSTSVNNGWEYNFGIELQHAGYINDSRIVRPANAYVARTHAAARSLHHVLLRENARHPSRL